MKCDKCDRAQKKGGKKRICKHVLDKLPPWKSGEAHEMVKLIYDQVGRSGDYDRESRGMIRDDGDVAFQSEWLDMLEKRAPYKKNHHPKWILCTCDPNGGGVSSDTAIVSAYYHSGKMIICGIDFHETKRSEKDVLMKAHIKGLRAVSRFKQSFIIFVPENNLDDAAQRLITAIKNFSRVHVYVDNKTMEGAKTLPWTKMKYTETAIEYLSEDGRVQFDPEIVCANPFSHSDHRAVSPKPELLRQLRQWRKIVDPGKTAKANPYITFTGKTDDTGMIVPGQKDDLSMAFVMNTYFSHVVQREKSQFPSEIFKDL